MRRIRAYEVVGELHPSNVCRFIKWMLCIVFIFCIFFSKEDILSHPTRKLCFELLIIIDLD